MVILQLDISEFGKLKNREISLRPGMNVITGDNESGKSTIGAYIRAMIYGFEEGSTEYTRYLPYGFSGGVFGGSMRVLVDGAFFVVFRNFLAGAEELRITKESDGALVEDPEFWLVKAVSGVSRARYEETGFAAQFSLQQDVKKWSGSSAGKDGQAELGIRNQYRKAQKVLEEKKQAFEEKLDAGVRVHYLEISEEVKDKETRFGVRHEEQTKNADKLAKMVQDLEKDRIRVAKENQDCFEKIKNNMLETKQALEPYRELTRAGGKNILGAVFLTLGLALVVAMLYVRYSWQIFSPDHPWFRYLLLGAGAATLVFIAGLVLTIVWSARIHRRKKEESELAVLKTRADEAEREYQNYMDHREELEQKIDKQSFREETIEALKSRQAILDAEIEKLHKEIDSLSAEQSDLKARFDEQQNFEIEIRSLDLAIDSFAKLGATRNAERNEQLEKHAMNYLSMLDKRKKDRIVIADDNTTTIITENGEVALSDLSMSAAQEVILAIRLAGVEEVDPNRTLPVILDDVFAGFDTERLNSCLNLLRSLSRQVILFSSQTRERRLL